MTPDDTLNAFFAADEAPEHDPGFTLDVAERIARREFHTTLVRRAAMTVALGAVAWGAAPLLGNLGEMVLTPTILIAGLVAGIGAFVPKIMEWIPLPASTRS